MLTGIERRVIRQFSRVDAVDPELNFAQQVQYTPFTSLANVTGLRAITLPVHQTADGLPMGVQLIGRPGREDVLLALGAQLERRIGWGRRHPPQW
jgi:amidase